ncbi:DUF4192 domain-containing protein [Actinomadura craniellae]|uniref:DUF4192 domain-containing protein n=1 Tax=Actinomadura craniellae TaxID=2231787 RepID=A0A365GXI2_9ACTN|nr:DUF4192 domain-containing protein [Actinomadura craniellae]RAY10633.1 DUF4192 domain-containing protein [Actinomadura craniellae]
MADNTTGGRRAPLVIRSPHDAVSAVPYLLGFHPDQSLVAIGTHGPHGTCALRLDLPEPDAAAAAGRQVAGLLARHRFPRALLIGYGPVRQVTPVIDAVGVALAGEGVEVCELLRVEGGRWWSYLCTDLGCCPPEGTPFDVSTSVVAAQATWAGHVALADRAELVRSVAPVGGVARAAMRRATGRAEARLAGWAGGALAVRARLEGEGLPVVRELSGRARAGGDPPDDDEVAWLGLLLTSVRLRDELWVRIDEEHLDAHIAFWRYVLCRVEERYAAAPASLLAYAAYTAGDGGLANVALDRAFGADPGYSMAKLLREVMRCGLPPSDARLRMTPEDLADAHLPHP